MKPVLFVVLALPMAWLIYAIVNEVNAPGSVLGADPGEAVVHFLGEWGIRVLLLSLMVSTARRLTGIARLIRYRRMIGLFAFTYLACHFLAYLGFLIQFDWLLFLEDFSERPYITVGMLALLILLLMALTSTSGWQRRLRRNWQKLHRLVYAAASLGLLHLIWLTREGFGEIVLYCVIFAGLMAERLWVWYRKTRRLRSSSDVDMMQT